MTNNKKILDFLGRLSKNNNKVWFEKHKHEFKELNDSFKQEVFEIADSVSKFDDGVYSEPDFVKFFRIYRDIRFSKDKTPYKENFGATIANGGKRSNNPVYYIHIQPNNRSFVGGGWLPNDPKDLYAIRLYISLNFDKFDAIMKSSDLKNTQLGEYMGVLKTTPKGFDKDDKAIEYIRHKSFTLGFDISDHKIASSDYSKIVIKHFKKIYPFLSFFYTALEEINKAPGKYKIG